MSVRVNKLFQQAVVQDAAVELRVTHFYPQVVLQIPPPPDKVVSIGKKTFTVTGRQLQISFSRNDFSAELFDSSYLTEDGLFLSASASSGAAGNATLPLLTLASVTGAKVEAGLFRLRVAATAKVSNHAQFAGKTFLPRVAARTGAKVTGTFLQPTLAATAKSNNLANFSGVIKLPKLTARTQSVAGRAAGAVKLGMLTMVATGRSSKAAMFAGSFKPIRLQSTAKTGRMASAAFRLQPICLEATAMFEVEAHAAVSLALPKLKATATNGDTSATTLRYSRSCP